MECRKYTFEITQDAKWSDGKNLTVDDIIFTMGLLADNSVNPVGHESWSKVKITKQDNYNFRLSCQTVLAILFMAWILRFCQSIS